MLTGLDDLNAAFLVAVAAAGAFLLWWPTRPRRPNDRLAQLGDRVGAVLGDVRVLTAIAAAVYVGVVVYDLADGLYDCSRAMGASDALAFLASGRAFLAGANPFTVANCGGTVEIPYGLAAVLVNALGSLGGLPGVVLVWGAVSVAVLPLSWWVAGPPRRYVILVVATSLLYLPIAVTQIDGASNLLVPAAVLLAVGLGRTRGPVAGAVGGFLASGRFPSLFPTVGASGHFRRPLVSGAVAVVAFAAVTAATYLAYGHAFVDVVFAGEVGRRSFSLNLYGILLAHGWLPSADALLAIQAAFTVALVAVVWWRARTAIGAAAIVLAGVALVTQFLSYNILAWLLPAALVGGRSRLWLWAIGVVGTLDYYVGYQYAAVGLGIVGPYEALDLVMTVLLVALLLDLWRTDAATPEARAGPAGPVTTS
jgi:hypothetical protein